MSHVCSECGGQLVVEGDVESYEVWGAAVSRRSHALLCEDCGADELDPDIVAEVVSEYEQGYAQHIEAEAAAYAAAMCDADGVEAATTAAAKAAQALTHGW